jgi:hypothetical protein
VAAPAGAASNRVAVGPKRQVLTVAKSRGLADGQVVTVQGRKYNQQIGIYVAFCVLNGKGVMPEPCGGGVNMSGTSASSYWISSNPPAYGKTLARPFRRGGSFKVRVKATRFIGSYDCKVVRCGFVTRADHTRGSYRLADVAVRVTFQ